MAEAKRANIFFFAGIVSVTFMSRPSHRERGLVRVRECPRRILMPTQNARAHAKKYRFSTRDDREKVTRTPRRNTAKSKGEVNLVDLSLTRILQTLFSEG